MSVCDVIFKSKLSRTVKALGLQEVEEAGLIKFEWEHLKVNSRCCICGKEINKKQLALVSNYKINDNKFETHTCLSCGDQEVSDILSIIYENKQGGS